VKALKIIFEGVNWVEKDGTTISLQSGLLTNAKARAYIYFGPSWKHADSSPDYLVPTKKIKAKPAMKADSFFDNGKALDEAIYLDPHTDPIEVNGDDDIDNLAMQARQNPGGCTMKATEKKKCGFTIAALCYKADESADESKK
jgi:hypothetical protein